MLKPGNPCHDPQKHSNKGKPIIDRFKKIGKIILPCMSAGEEEVHDLFYEETPVQAPREHHFVDVERPKELGTLHIRMVKKHVLWGDHLWNAGQWLASNFDAHPEEIRGKSVVELGAGAGLPSVVSALNGAKMTVVTDYPDPELIENLAWNLEENVKDAASERAVATGFLWGAPVDDILALNEGNQYDVVILCDLLFNHSEHTKLVKSCQELLAPNGHVLVLIISKLLKSRRFGVYTLTICPIVD
jgi:nicotinamide N-methyltransferase